MVGGCAPCLDLGFNGRLLEDGPAVITLANQPRYARATNAKRSRRCAGPLCPLSALLIERLAAQQDSARFTSPREDSAQDTIFHCDVDRTILDHHASPRKGLPVKQELRTRKAQRRRGERGWSRRC